jgi:hypothetical protein
MPLPYTTSAVWASLIARDTDITPEHEDNRVWLSGAYTRGSHRTLTDPAEPECAEVERIYLLDGPTIVRELTQDEYDIIDWGRANEALLDSIQELHARLEACDP